MSELDDAIDLLTDDKYRSPEITDARFLVLKAARRYANGIPTPFCATHNRTVPPPSLTEHIGHHSPTEGCHIVKAVIALGITTKDE